VVALMQEDYVSGETSRRRFGLSGGRRRAGKRHKGAWKRNVSYSSLVLLSVRCHALDPVNVPCCGIQLQPRHLPSDKVNINLEMCLGFSGLVLTSPPLAKASCIFDDIDEIDVVDRDAQQGVQKAERVVPSSLFPDSGLEAVPGENLCAQVPVPVDNDMCRPELRDIFEPFCLELVPFSGNAVLGAIRLTKGLSFT
jgi:hypothetical protein